MLKEIKGSYYPSTFSMFLNKPNCNIDITDSTFVHEYIHFLQDLILPYCIRENNVFISSFQCILQNGYTDRLLHRPFDKWSSDCTLTARQTNFTWGQGSSNSGKIVSISSNYFVTKYGHNIYRYILNFDNGCQYQLGARDFLEYIAHKIQNRFWTTNAPDLPYKTIDKIFDFYNLSIVPESIRLLIAEFCLLNDNPAHMLISQFIGQKLIENNKNKFTNYDICVDFLLNTGWVSKGGFKESVYSKTNRRLDDFAQRLTELYPHKQFESIKEWIILTNQICRTELANKFIFSYLYCLSMEEMLAFIKHMVDAIGIPLIIFNDNTITSTFLPASYDSTQFIEFYIMKQFVIWMRNKDRNCPLKDICVANFNDYIPICDNNPNNIKKDCIWGKFLSAYGFDQYPIIIQQF